MFAETLEELFCFKPQKLAQLGPRQLCQEPGQVTLFGSGCPVSSYLICSCIICITEISVLGNESDCGEPRLPLVWKLSLVLSGMLPSVQEADSERFYGGKVERGNYQAPTGGQVDSFSQHMLI